MALDGQIDKAKIRKWIADTQKPIRVQLPVQTALGLARRRFFLENRVAPPKYDIGLWEDIYKRRYGIKPSGKVSEHGMSPTKEEQARWDLLCFEVFKILRQRERQGLL